ncbi:MAG: hypothetical protein ABI894_11525 [Ilumatobacteraceae bacterium]
MPQEPIGEPGVAEPVHVVPATEPGMAEPVHIVPASEAIQPAGYVAPYAPTEIVPVVEYQAPVAPVAPVAPAPVPTVVPVGPLGQGYIDDRRPAWPYFAALLALIVGGVVGFLIGNSREDNTATVSSNSQPIDTTVGSTPSAADLQNQVEMLTAAQTKAAEDLAGLQAALTKAESERDALAAQVGDAGGTNTDLQAELDASKAEVAKLQTDLKTVTTQLDAANQSVVQTQAQLKTVQGQLDTANATLAALHPIPLPNYVNGNITKARQDAQTNGWTLIERPASTQGNVGTILQQAPAPNTTMVTGSVLYVEVA